MERILVWGVGAISGTVGAHLVRAGHDVTFVDIVPDHVAAIRACGRPQPDALLLELLP